MRRPSKRTIRSAALAVIVVAILLLANSAVAATSTNSPDGPDGTDAGTATAGDVPYGAYINVEPTINRTDVTEHPIPEGAELTVIATQGFFVSDENADIFAITRDGTVVYHNATYKVYFDVDPVPGEKYTIEYVASKQIPDCETFEPYWCTLNVIERANLSTGETERIYAERTPKVHATRWHDADRINETHVAIADIYNDSATIVNTETDEVVWEWKATEIYSEDQGGNPQDWTHVNDVEVLDDGTLMLSMRNMDEVVFVKPGEGYLENLTLGVDEDHSILYEQHNPDYINESQGGPAIVVGDSENNRIIEFQRVNGTWERSWLWRDSRMQWPRDADRLPNNNTLVVDSHGDRVLEINPNGSVAWSVGVGMPYDVERMGTGDESANSLSMRAIQGSTGGIANASPIDRFLIFMKDTLPSPWVNSLLYIGPAWMRFADLLVAVGMLGTLLLWGGLEYRWARWSITGVLRGAFRRVRKLS